MVWLVIGLIGLIAAAEYYSLTGLPRYISAKSRPSNRTSEPGVPFLLRTTLQNVSRLPATLLTVTERIPPAAHNAEHEQNGKEARLELDATGSRLSYKTWLMPRQQLIKEIPMRIDTRGCYVFRGTSVYVGDFMGLKGSVREFERHEEIVIYPEPLGGTELKDTLGGYLGEISVRRFILEDPVLTIGLAEYTGREPMRAINGKQTARSGRAMVNQYDHTTELSAAVVLNLEYTARYEADRALLERTLSCARSVIEALEEKHIRYSFYSNLLTAGAVGDWLYVPEGLGAAHMHGILEGLGRSTLDTSESPASLLDRVLRHADQGRCCIIITPDGKKDGSLSGGAGSKAMTEPERDIPALAARISERTGQSAMVLAVGEGAVTRWL